MFTKHTIVLTYVIFSICWIAVTDFLLNAINLSGNMRMFIEMAKGGIFIAISSTFLYLILKKNEQYKKIAEDEQQLSTLINSMPDFVCFKDSEGRWIRVNDFGRKLYQLEQIDYRGKTDRELGEFVPFFKDVFENCIQTDEEAWKEGGLTRREESFYVPSGEQKTFDVIKVPLFYESGERKGLLTIGRDITQQKVAESLLLKKEKLSVLGEMAAGLAHEIRNPLTSIKGFIQVMEETKEVKEEHIDIVLNELDRINQIVSELLVLADPQLHSYKPFRLHEAIQYVMNLVGHEAMLNNISVTLEGKETNPFIYGDKNQLIQVLINVMKNSIEAMPEGGFLTFSVKEEGDDVQIVISDTGIGISEERLQKIGEPFFTLKEKGVGLGLTTSTKIIQEHKGTLQIESEVGKGTSVYITLPQYKGISEVMLV